ncbi:MAG: CDP-glycerol glycerophosphotransferase family protein [Synergistaceae bacterium]|nr:CDP-glycerol glycerophosphotransferase family protein [Synergistaceae bacterium]
MPIEKTRKKKLKRCVSIAAAALVLCLVPGTAHAYLDPGSGNVIIYVLISVFGAVLYSLKGVFWGFFGKSNQNVLKYNLIVIFSEGKNYWNTFKPIVNALLMMKQPFSYYSMDIDDPGLIVESDWIRSRYIGEGSMAFARMSQVHSKVMLSTTPNIGSPGFPMPRPKYIEHLVHVCHSLDIIAPYKKGSLDCYDAVLLTGSFLASDIRYLEELRGLKPKELIPAGLPYLDDLASKMKNPLPPTDGKTILIASSWGTKGCLFVYGSRFIQLLAEAGYNIILRPHPHSWKIEENLLQRVKSELDDYKNVEWDREPDAASAMERADILVSDTSNIRMDYALLYERPVITLKFVISDLETFELSDMDEAWIDKAELEIGVVVHEEEIDHIAEIVGDVLSKKEKRNLAAFRAANLYNFGSSGEVIAQYLVNLVQPKG